MTGTIPATDPDSLKSGPNGSLILTGEADHALMFISNPGQANQFVSFLNLVTATGGSTPGAPDDALFPTSSQGTFYVADPMSNTIYAITASGLTSGSLYADVGTAFSSVDPNTGVVTPIFTGMDPHGMDFVPSPEPGALGLCSIGLIFGAALLRRRANRNRA